MYNLNEIGLNLADARPCVQYKLMRVVGIVGISMCQLFK